MVTEVQTLHNKIQGGRATPSICRLNQIASAQILEIEIQVAKFNADNF
jgi:hypothetical protein